MEFDSFQRASPTLNLSALIDIVFILVIFIVLAASFERIRDLDVELPAAKGQGSTDEAALVVTVPRDGPLRIDGRDVPHGEAAEVLRTLRASHESVLLVADREAALERAVRVLADARVAGFESVSIATRDPR